MITEQDTVLVGYSAGLAGAIAMLAHEIVRQNPSFESEFRAVLLKCGDQLKSSEDDTISKPLRPAFNDGVNAAIESILSLMNEIRPHDRTSSS